MGKYVGKKDEDNKRNKISRGKRKSKGRRRLIKKITSEE